MDDIRIMGVRKLATMKQLNEGLIRRPIAPWAVLQMGFISTLVYILCSSLIKENKILLALVFVAAFVV